MKKWKLTICLLFSVFCILSSCVQAEPNDPAIEKNQSVTLWLNLGNFDQGQADYGLWLGYRTKVTDNLDAEVGFAGNYHQWDVEQKNNFEYSLAFGAYGAIHLIDFIDVNMPYQFEGFPVKLIGQPFLSFEYLKDSGDGGQSYGPGTGARIFDLAAFKVQYNIVEGIPVANHLTLSLSFRFKF